MSGLYSTYEEEFTELTSSVQKKIPETDFSEHTNILGLKKQMHQAEKALKQMEIEVTMAPSSTKPQQLSALKVHRKQWRELMDTLKRHESSFYDAQNQEVLMGSFIDSGGQSVQNQQLLMKQNAALQDGIRVMGQTESSAIESLKNLEKQKQQIQHAGDGARDMITGLISSENLLQSMQRRARAHRVLLVLVGLFLLVVFMLVLYRNK